MSLLAFASIELLSCLHAINGSDRSGSKCLAPQRSVLQAISYFTLHFEPCVVAFHCCDCCRFLHIRNLYQLKGRSAHCPSCTRSTGDRGGSLHVPVRHCIVWNIESKSLNMWCADKGGSAVCCTSCRCSTVSACRRISDFPLRCSTPSIRLSLFATGIQARFLAFRSLPDLCRLHRAEC